MAVLVTDPDLGERLIADRQSSDSDRFDEVWEGLYIMAPLPNDEHQEIQANFVAALKDAFGWDSPAKIRAGVNISDRSEGWEHNYRCPDVVVFLPGNVAINRGAHWEGGPDFLVEITSEGDRALEKLPFYAGVGVKEVLLIRRKPWALELYSAVGPSEMRMAGAISPDSTSELRSGVLAVAFQLVTDGPRPKIKVMLSGPDVDKSRSRTSWFV